MDIEKRLLDTVEEEIIENEYMPFKAKNEGHFEIPGDKIKSFFDNIITAETGEGTIESYIDHPLNFNNSKSFGQVIRGISGLFGSLELAIVDVIVGIFKMNKEVSKNVG